MAEAHRPLGSTMRVLRPAPVVKGAQHLDAVENKRVVIFANHLSYSDANVVEIVLRSAGAGWLAAPEPGAGVGADPEAGARGRRVARDRGRFTRNFVVQASAADWALVLLAAVRRRLDVVALCRQRAFEHPADRSVVVDEEQSGHVTRG